MSGSADAASLTAAFGLVLDAQLSGDRAAWVSLAGTSFFPPDVMDGGIDLDALPVVRVPDARAAGRAADHLVRSGGFGLVVIDLVVVAKGDFTSNARAAAIPIPLLTRLLGLARAHEAAVVILTKKSHDAPSLNSLISLRAETGRSCFLARMHGQALRQNHRGIVVELSSHKCAAYEVTSRNRSTARSSMASKIRYSPESSVVVEIAIASEMLCARKSTL